MVWPTLALMTLATRYHVQKRYYLAVLWWDVMGGCPPVHRHPNLGGNPSRLHVRCFTPRFSPFCYTYWEPESKQPAPPPHSQMT